MTISCPGVRAKSLVEAIVGLNEGVAEGLWRIKLDLPSWEAPDPEPGQFVMLRAGEGTDPLLARPFGVADYARSGSGATVELIYRVVGRGTALMTRWRPGFAVRLLGPLGKGFPAPAAGGHHFLVAGGAGLPPLLFLARRLAAEGRGGEATLVYGEPNARRAAPAAAWLTGAVRVLQATDDGTAGLKGTVTDAMEDLAPSRKDRLCACGPATMLRALHGRYGGFLASTHFSWESRMACGFGVCAGCAVRVRTPMGPAYVRTCREGPVFSGAELLAESFAERL